MVVLAAFGAQVSLGTLLTVYDVGSILAMLPITPGGLGVVEGVMVSSLIGFDTSASVALLGVLGWRLLEFWLPIPLGALTYASLRLTGRHSSAQHGSPPRHPPRRRSQQRHRRDRQVAPDGDHPRP